MTVHSRDLRQIVTRDFVTEDTDVLNFEIISCSNISKFIKRLFEFKVILVMTFGFRELIDTLKLLSC